MPRKYDKNVFNPKYFHLEFLTEAQNEAYELYKQNDILFLTGLAGTGKTFLAIAFAVRDVLEKNKNKIILSRPVVEAGENLGFLPGDMDEKIYPYMLPLYDSLDKICGSDGENREYIDKRYELAPIAFLRGRTFQDCVCILDEGQNCTKGQLKLFLTRLGTNSKMIITGDPTQTDLTGKNVSGLNEVIDKLAGVKNIGIMEFTEDAIVRHPLVAEIVKRI
jgi:phosphate starvation-inducible protein PhoH and related proteins